jgi:hypothetical protein
MSLSVGLTLIQNRKNDEYVTPSDTHNTSLVDMQK